MWTIPVLQIVCVHTLFLWKCFWYLFHMSVNTHTESANVGCSCNRNQYKIGIQVACMYVHMHVYAGLHAHARGLDPLHAHRLHAQATDLHSVYFRPTKVDYT